MDIHLYIRVYNRLQPRRLTCLKFGSHLLKLSLSTAAAAKKQLNKPDLLQFKNCSQAAARLIEQLQINLLLQQVTLAALLGVYYYHEYLVPIK
jgi:hypothetical protein